MSNEVLLNRLMSEIGLDIDETNHIVDQDTGSSLQFNGKNLIFIDNPMQRINKRRNDIPFNPIESPKLMNHLFSYYINKIHEEDGRYINIYYPVQEPGNRKGCIELKEETTNTTIRSNEYSNDCLKYMDLILQLNGNDDNDLSDYDFTKD